MRLLASLDNIIKIEQEDVWKKKQTHESIEAGGFLDSHVHIDILTVCKTHFHKQSIFINININI